MEFLTLVIALGVLLWIRSDLSGDIKFLSNEIKSLKDSIQKLKQQLSEKVEPKKDTPGTDYEKYMPPAQQPPPVVVPPSPPPIIKIKTEEEIIRPVQEQRKPVPERIKQVIEPPRTIPKPPKPSKPSFFERNPDLEKFIGENLINKIGIAILVLGIAFFVKYAIGRGWIAPAGRVSIGILSGGILIGLAHLLRKKFHAFSSVLVGGGLAVLYFTIGIAFHKYGLFNIDGDQILGQRIAFAIMVVITGFAVVLTLAYNRVELAVLALIGGFCTPYIVSTGEGNYKVLFTYLLILNCGMLALAYRKKWNLVNILSYAFTILSYGSWLLVRCLGEQNAPYAGALIFGTAFYLVFFLMNIIYNMKNNIPFRAFEISMLLSNTFLYYGAGMSILYYYYETTYQGLFTALMGVFNFAFAFTFYKRQNADRNLIFLLIGLVLTFVSLTAPIQLEGNHITLFWAAEAVLLLWLSQKSGIKLIKGTSLAVTVLMLISLLMDWAELYGQIASPEQRIPFLNKAFVTGIVSLISVALTVKLLAGEKEEYFVFKEFALKLYKVTLKIVFIALLYFSFLLEINYQMSEHGYNHNAITIVTGIYNFSFLALAFLIYRKSISGTLALVITLTSGLLLVSYTAAYNPAVIAVRDSFLQQNTDALFFFLHFALAILFSVTVYIFYTITKKHLSTQLGEEWIKWVAVFFIVFICSAELNHIVTWISYSQGRIISEINKQVFKAGYSVLWGIISLILIQQGMKLKDRALRIISLTLFFITILKLFFWDIRGISESGKIIAFISLGILLLLVSFMYQRLKRLILEGETTSRDKQDEVK